MPIKVAVVTDVHGNLPALQAALAAIAGEGCDAIYHLGDVVGRGPFPAESLELLLNTPKVRFIMGNHDELVVVGLPEADRVMSDEEVRHHAWVHEQIPQSRRVIMAEWPYIIEETWHGVKVKFVHYALEDDGKTFAAAIQTPSAVELDRLFADPRVDLIFYGHVHLPSDEQGMARYVNLGSIGCSSEALAPCAILEIAEDGRYIVQKRMAAYDPTALFQQFEEREVPRRDWIVEVLFRQNASR